MVNCGCARRAVCSLRARMFEGKYGHEEVCVSEVSVMNVVQGCQRGAYILDFTTLINLPGAWKYKSRPPSRVSMQCLGSCKHPVAPTST